MEIQKCDSCKRERTMYYYNDYNPLQAIMGAPLGWYSADDGEVCPECMTKMLRQQGPAAGMSGADTEET